MTQAIKQHQQLLHRALTLLNRIESREELMNEARTPEMFNQAKALKEKSQMEYSQTMAALHCLIMPFVENDTHQSDADLLKNVDDYMNQITINANANGLIEKPHSVFSSQINKATTKAQQAQKNYFGEEKY